MPTLSPAEKRIRILLDKDTHPFFDACDARRPCGGKEKDEGGCKKGKERAREAAARSYRELAMSTTSVVTPRAASVSLQRELNSNSTSLTTQ